MIITLNPVAHEIAISLSMPEALRLVDGCDELVNDLLEFKEPDPHTNQSIESLIHKLSQAVVALGGRS